MDVEALTTFVAIHRTGTITRAAEALYRSQPAVSRRLAMLERELGVPLFERVPGGLVLSEAGRVLMPFAERAVATLRDAEEAVRAVHSSEDRGRVEVALVGTLASTALTAVLRRFGRRHPGVEVALRTATSAEVSELVRRGDVAVGLRYAEDRSPDLRCEPLFLERMVVVAAPDHPLAGLRLEGLGALDRERWLAFPDLPGRPEASGAYVRRALDAAGVPEASILRIDSLTAQKRLVEAAFGIALIPESAAEEELRAGSLRTLDIRSLDVAVQVTVITRTHAYLSAATRALLEELRLSGAGLSGGQALERGRGRG